MRRKIIHILSLMSGLLLLTSSFVYAATISFEIDNTELLTSLGYDTGIEGFIWVFDYTGSMTYYTVIPGDAIDPATWFLSVMTDRPENGKCDVQGVDIMGWSPMVDGTIATLSFDGSLAIDSWEFRDRSNNTIFDIELTSYDLSDGGIVKFTCVPIPGALILLGSGLIGLIGLGRRRMKRS